MMLNEYMAEFSDLTVILDVGFRLTFYASINRLIPTASAAGDWSSSLNGSWRVAISLCYHNLESLIINKICSSLCVSI